MALDDKEFCAISKKIDFKLVTFEQKTISRIIFVEKSFDL